MAKNYAKKRNGFNKNNGSNSGKNGTSGSNDLPQQNATNAKKNFASYSRYQFRVPIKPIDLSYGTKGSLLGEPKLNQDNMNVPDMQPVSAHTSSHFKSNNMNKPPFSSGSLNPSDPYPSPYAQNTDLPYNSNHLHMQPNNFLPNDNTSPKSSFNCPKDPHQAYEAANPGYGYETNDTAKDDPNHANERSIPYELLLEKFDVAIKTDDLSLCCKSLKDLVYFYPLKLLPRRWIRAIDLFIKFDLLSLIWETIPLIPWNSNQDYQWCFEAVIDSDLPPNFNVAFFAHNMFYTLVVNDIELSNKIKNYLLEAFYKADNAHDCMAVLSHINKFDPNYKIPSFLFSYLDPTKDNKL